MAFCKRFAAPQVDGRSGAGHVLIMAPSSTSSPNPALQLVGYGPSVYTWIVKVALIEMGLKVDYIETNPFAETPDPLLARYTPFDRVPVLVHGDFRLTETAAILRYLDQLSAT